MMAVEAAIEQPRRLRIGIASLGRFHVLDLARELAALGHEVCFYSYVPKSRAIRFGLPAACHVSLLPWMLPLVLLERALGTRGAGIMERVMYPVANLLVRCKLRPCDVFIGMSGVYLEAATYARSRYGAKVIIERGSRHILSQHEILGAIAGARQPSRYVVRRELAGYLIADKIAVPSRQVLESFLENGISADRVFVNAYGVDLDIFQAPLVEAEPAYDLVFVGGWSLRKGADILSRVMQSAEKWRLVHVGRVADAPFPQTDNVVSLGSVDQQALPGVYQKARVLVLPSREEGLALVQIQALACGIPVVCTDRTGGSDLREVIEHKEAVVVAPVNDVEGLAAAIKQALAVSRELRGRDLLGESGRRYLTWAAYGGRYEGMLLRMCGAIR